jgi:hypothetical protein
MGHFVRTQGAEHAAIALVGVDDPQQHAQRRGLARAVGPEHAVDRALRHRQVDAVHRGEPVEPFHQPAGLDCERAFR